MTDGRTDGPTKRGVESRSTRLKRNRIKLLSVTFDLFVLRTEMEIYRKGGEIWPTNVILFLDHMGLTNEEVESLKKNIKKIEKWLGKKSEWDDDGDSSDEDNTCKCHAAMNDLLIPCGDYLE